MTKVRFSAVVSKATKRQLTRHADSQGLKKGWLVEQALLHSLQAVRELPVGIVVGGDRGALHPAEMSKESVKALKSARAPAEQPPLITKSKRSADAARSFAARAFKARRPCRNS